MYRIANRCSGKALTVADASAADRARIRIAGFTGGDHQRWRIELQADGTYRLTAQHSGKVVDASSRVLEDGVPVFHQMPWHGGANQRFAIEPLDDGSYRMLVRHNGKALDVRGASVADGATVWQWDWNGTCAQRWTLERVDVVDTTPVATAVHAGNDQQATAGTAVPVAPAIRVTDRAGRGVADAQVTFVVVAGGGSVTGAQQRTNAEGIAAVGSWTLGSTAGENILSARTAGLPEVTFRATARAPQGSGTLSAAPGSSNQSATVGTALPLAPAVVVRDASGTVRSGITVSFTPRNGGSVQQTTAVSDASGLASPGRWTLGPVAGTQTLEAAADGFGTAVLSASALAGDAPTLTRSVFMGGLQTPWDMAFAPDGVLLYTERA
ncbi:MAG: RICIN domain-containing protein, partial [Burkholderiaceae bacterium]|nr:RICIN domain-containing protein [Burkholderiaceae bacterium]